MITRHVLFTIPLLHLANQQDESPQASLNVRDTEGRSPLMWAVWEGKLQIVTQLVEVGGATQVTEGTGRLLFQVTGVDVRTKDGEGRTLEQVAR